MITIEKHNAHGLNIVIGLSRSEAADLAAKLTAMAVDFTADLYIELPAKMEDDNDRWEACELDFRLNP